MLFKKPLVAAAFRNYSADDHFNSTATTTPRGLLLNAYDLGACKRPGRVPDPFVSTSGIMHGLLQAPPSKSARLLLMSYSRLLWYDTVSGTEELLREEPEARFRGAFYSDAGNSLIVLSTPGSRANYSPLQESIFVEVSLSDGSGA